MTAARPARSVRPPTDHGRGLAGGSGAAAAAHSAAAVAGPDVPALVGGAGGGAALLPAWYKAGRLRRTDVRRPGAVSDGRHRTPAGTGGAVPRFVPGNEHPVVLDRRGRPPRRGLPEPRREPLGRRRHGADGLRPSLPLGPDEPRAQRQSPHLHVDLAPPWPARRGSGLSRNG